MAALDENAPQPGYVQDDSPFERASEPYVEEEPQDNTATFMRKRRKAQIKQVRGEKGERCSGGFWGLPRPCTSILRASQLNRTHTALTV
jgi:hypothetical protein